MYNQIIFVYYLRHDFNSVSFNTKKVYQSSTIPNIYSTIILLILSTIFVTMERHSKANYESTIVNSVKTSPDKNRSRYYTFQKQKKLYHKNDLHSSIEQDEQPNLNILSLNKTPAKLVNFEIDEHLFPANQFSGKFQRKNNIGFQFAKSHRTGNKKKERYLQNYHEITRRGRGLKIVTRIRNNLDEEDNLMKNYMCIEKINLPKSGNHESIINIRRINKEFSEASAPHIKPNPQQNPSSLKKQKKQLIRQVKTTKNPHRRNLSSLFVEKQSHQSSITTPAKNKRELLQEFTVRKPVLRKDYFVFGMSDRTSQESKTQYFRDFLWKINYSNGLNVHTPQNVENPYRVYIGPGNNYHLIKGMMKKRFWWTIIDRKQDLSGCNLVWTQLKQNVFFSQQKSDCSAITNQKKENIEWLQQNNDHPGWYGHQKIFGKHDLESWIKYYQKNAKSEEKITEKTYIQRLSLFKFKNIKNISSSQTLKVHNHLENNFFIGNKKALFYNMRKYFQLKHLDPFTVLPLTFHITKGVDDPEFKLFKEYFEKIEATKKTDNIKNVWIVKPGENTNRGNGITVCYSLDDIHIRLKGRQRNNDGKLRTFIIQKYIENPLLYYRRKFDIRHYMLITCVNGFYKSYWFEEGYLRTSSNQFNLRNCKDPLIHLTNDAVQKNHQNYGKFEKGNKLSYGEFQRYLQSKPKYKRVNFFDDILPKMKEMAADSVRATYCLLDRNRKNHNFQLLGLDFMIDDDLKPWLIEVNTNPCLEICSSLLEKIIPQLIDNTLKICVDPLFPPPENWQSNKKIYFGDNPLAENKFELIFDENVEGNLIEGLYKGVQMVDNRMGKVEEDDEEFEDDGDQNWECACKN